MTPVINIEKDIQPATVTVTSCEDDIVAISEDKHMQAYSFDKDLDMPDFNLTELLEQAPMGRAIILYYNNKNSLNNTLRNKLVDIIMRHLFSYYCKQYDNLYYVYYISIQARIFEMLQ